MEVPKSEYIQWFDEEDSIFQVSEGSPHYEAVLGTRGEGFTLREILRDSQGRSLSISKRLLYRRLRRLQKLMEDYETKRQSQMVMELHRAADYLGLTRQAKERAINIYLKAVRKMSNGNIRRDLIALAAASILIAVRELGHAAPITLEEVAEAFKKQGIPLRPMRIAEQAKRIEKVLRNRLPMRSAKDYLVRAIDEIVTDPEIRERIEDRGLNPAHYRQRLLTTAAKLIEETETLCKGRRPYIVAVSAAYAADRLLALKSNSKPILTQRLVSKATGVSECTIREQYNSLFRIRIIRHVVSEALRFSPQRTLGS